jgi:hypothetical protein
MMSEIKIERTVVNAPSRKLKAGWSVISKIIPPQPAFQIYDDAHFNYGKDRYNVPDGWCVVDVLTQVASWIESQSHDQWRGLESRHNCRFMITEELFVVMALRWS